MRRHSTSSFHAEAQVRSSHAPTETTARPSSHDSCPRMDSQVDTLGTSFVAVVSSSVAHSSAAASTSSGMASWLKTPRFLAAANTVSTPRISSSARSRASSA